MNSSISSTSLNQQHQLMGQHKTSQTIALSGRNKPLVMKIMALLSIPLVRANSSSAALMSTPSTGHANIFKVKSTPPIRATSISDVNIDDLKPKQNIESYSPKNSTYPKLADYHTMLRNYAGPTGALALKHQDPFTGSVRYEPFCTAWLFADDTVGSAGHCSFTSDPTSFLSCYQKAYPQGNDIYDKNNITSEELRDCYAFDVVNQTSIFEFDDNFNGTNEPGGFRLSAKDFSMQEVEGKPGKLFGTLGFNLKNSLPTFINHHTSGAPLLHSAAIPIELSRNPGNRVENWIFKSDLLHGSSGSAILDEEGLVTGILSWGSPACHIDDYDLLEAYHHLNIEDNFLIRKLESSNASCEPLEAIDGFYKRPDCVIGGQTILSALNVLPADARQFVLDNAQATPGSWDFNTFKEYMVDCLCSNPGEAPSANPSVALSLQPNLMPSLRPSSAPSAQPSLAPSTQPSLVPSSRPSLVRSPQPSLAPSTQPSLIPSSQPSLAPSTQPSSTPTLPSTSGHLGISYLDIIIGAVGGTGLTLAILAAYKFIHRTPDENTDIPMRV